MADRDLSREMETLRDDMGKLRADISAVAETLKDLGKSRVDDAKASLSGLVDSLKEELLRGWEGARERGKKSVETVEHQIEQRPFISVLAAFGVGVLLGKLLDRR